MKRLTTLLMIFACLGILAGTANAQFAITTTSPLPNGSVGQFYQLQFTVQGGAGDDDWDLAEGSNLPANLSLSLTGILSGVPAQAGQYTFTVEVTEGVFFHSKTFVLNIVSASSQIQITTASPLPDAIVGLAYQVQITATGGSGQNIWKVVNSSLPSNLTLGSSSGVLSGIPIKAGQYTFNINVEDYIDYYNNDAKTFVLTVFDPPSPLVITTPYLPFAAVDSPYHWNMAAQGGLMPYTWSIYQGTLPPGVDLAGDGTLSGVPTEEGSYTIRVRVTDYFQTTADRQFNIFVNTALKIETVSPLPSATMNAPYSFNLESSGGVGRHDWYRVGGALPQGVVLSESGTLSGTPTQQGTSQFRIAVYDISQAYDEKTFSLTVNPPVAITTSSPLPTATEGVQYSPSLSASGGTTPYSWTHEGNLPPGLLLSEAGQLSGQPSTAGNYSFSVQVSDLWGSTANRQFSLTVNSQTSALMITTPSPLPSGTVGVEYEFNMAATGGDEPYTWELTDSSLPSGLTINEAGVISGTPTQAGQFGPIYIRVYDANEDYDQQTFYLTINVEALAITTDSYLPDGTAGSSYLQTFVASGGTEPYSWEVLIWYMVMGTPYGLELSEVGVLSGTPSHAGDIGFRVQVSDANGQTATKDHYITINSPSGSVGASIENLPEQTSTAQQHSFQVRLNSAYQLPLAGQVTLTFTPDAVNPMDDETVQLSTGGRTANFTIPAGQTTASFDISDISIQTGSVAGTITLAITLSAGGEDVTPSPQPARQVQVMRGPPEISSVSAIRTGSNLQVQVVGISSPREVTQVTFQFTPSSGANLQTAQLTLTVNSAFASWYQNEDSGAYGSAFQYTQTFTIQGDSNAVASVTVTLSNSEGSSQPVTASF